MHEQKSKEGERDFDDFLAGKKSQQTESLTSTFQQFYAKMKEQDKKLKATMKSLDEKEGISLNSARASLNSFSDKLEKRRQAFKEARLKEQKEKEEAAEKRKAEEAAQEAKKEEAAGQDKQE